MLQDRLVVQQEGSNRGSYVLYWMQQAQRITHNAAWQFAIELANHTKLPLVVLFVVNGNVPEANVRHYYFMMQGLYETALAVEDYGAEFIFAYGEAVPQVLRFAGEASAVVTDRGYLRYQRSWRNELMIRLAQIGCTYCELETEPLVPVEIASDKEEYSAATLRRKLLRLLPDVQLEEKELVLQVKRNSGIKSFRDAYKLGDDGFAALWKWVQDNVQMNTMVAPIADVKGGAAEARKLLKLFVTHKLDSYDAQRSNPALDASSGLSPYLHFGQISAMEIVQQAMQHHRTEIGPLSLYLADRKDLPKNAANLASFAEELIVRRELSFNFCHYNAQYDSFSCLPQWAKRTLLEHEEDQRKEQYSLDRMEQCATNDVYWNAAQREMMLYGRMHNYMRMYWGKCVIAWCKTPEEAYRNLLYLNNKYELDGRDPNAYAGVAWCFGKHDRPWQPREIYGMVRYMNAAGLTRKFNMEAYLTKVNHPKGT